MPNSTIASTTAALPVSSSPDPPPHRPRVPAREHRGAGPPRQEAIVAGARAAGYYVAAIYRDKASAARPDRPELLRMVHDLQPGEVMVAERIDCISRLPLPEAEFLVATIRAQGAILAVPGIVDLSDLAASSAGVSRIVLEAVQEMLLRVALRTPRDDYQTRRERQRQGIEIARRAGRYTDRKTDTAPHRRIPALRQAGMSIARTAVLVECSPAHVKRVTALYRVKAASTATDATQAAEGEGNVGQIACLTSNNEVHEPI